MELQHYMNVLEIWPPKAPVLNPIEMLWSIVGRKRVIANVKTEDEMFAEGERIWNELDQELSDRLVLDF
jgi:transposase